MQHIFCKNKYLLLLILSLLFFCSCSTRNRTTFYDSKYPYIHDDRTHLDLIQYFAEKGFKPSRIYPTNYRTILATGGFILFVKGVKLEFYIYNGMKRAQLKKFDTIMEKGYIDVLSLKIPVVVNGRIIMVNMNADNSVVNDVKKEFLKFPLNYHKNKLYR